MKRTLILIVSVFSFVFNSPNARAQWQPTNGPFGDGSSVQALASIGSNLFAGTYGGGVFISTDEGTNWSKVNNGISDTMA